MIGIRAICSYIPVTAIDNIEQGQSFGETENFIRSKIGALQLPRKEMSEETSDMAAKAVRKLVENANIALENVDVAVVVTQNGDGMGLPHTSAILQHKLGLRKTIPVFDISLGCSGYVYGLTILKGFMEASGFKNGVLVTADPYSKVIDPSDRITALLFGDAASATWMGENADWELCSCVYFSDGSGAEHLRVEGGILRMNGRQIFNFAVSNVPLHINTLLEKERLRPQDVDLFCLHQGSAAIVEAVARQFPSVQERFIIEMVETGNTVSSSIPLLLEKHLCRPEIKRILLSGFGVGLSLATTIIEKREGTIC
jgi:3-oxoacyl-[acyl-carrier-protein] synthase-3